MKEILNRVARGDLTPRDAEKLLRAEGILEIGTYAKVDLGRENRKGIPEIVLAEGKEPSQVVEIAKRILESQGRVILSRVGPNHLRALNSLKSISGAWNTTPAGLLILKKRGFKIPKTGGLVGILTAGTSDIRVAEEAKIVAEEMGCTVLVENDVGVAGIHRVFPALKKMIERDVDVIIVAAGREGALPTVIAGLVDLPVIGLPVSTGYGVGGLGEAALKAMLQACSLGIAVVNIDSGVAAGAFAALVANRVAKSRKRRSAPSLK